MDNFGECWISGKISDTFQEFEGNQNFTECGEKMQNFRDFDALRSLICAESKAENQKVDRKRITASEK